MGFTEPSCSAFSYLALLNWNVCFSDFRFNILRSSNITCVLKWSPGVKTAMMLTCMSRNLIDTMNVLAERKFVKIVFSVDIKWPQWLNLQTSTWTVEHTVFLMKVVTTFNRKSFPSHITDLFLPPRVLFFTPQSCIFYTFERWMWKAWETDVSSMDKPLKRNLWWISSLWQDVFSDLLKSDFPTCKMHT